MVGTEWRLPNGSINQSPDTMQVIRGFDLPRKEVSQWSEQTENGVPIQAQDSVESHLSPKQESLDVR